MQALHHKGFYQRSIAEAIGVHHSSISRELKRDWPKKMRMGSRDKQAVRGMELGLKRTPRKILKGLTPIEVYTGRCVALIA
nr:helix-turn-helix domain-containing protein [unidentified bacterial endosymbiont]